MSPPIRLAAGVGCTPNPARRNRLGLGGRGAHNRRVGVLAPWHGNDMPTITSPLLQTLAEVNDEDAAAISVYLDLDPSVTATPADIASRVRSAVDRLAAASEQRSGGAKRKFDDG